MHSIIGFLLVGRLVVFVLQKFPLQKVIFIGRLFEEGKFLEQLFECDLCLGFWLYSTLSFIYDVNLVTELGYVVIISNILTGALSTFVVHLLSIGWKNKFGVFLVE